MLGGGAIFHATGWHERVLTMLEGVSESTASAWKTAPTRHANNRPSQRKSTRTKPRPSPPAVSQVETSPRIGQTKLPLQYGHEDLQIPWKKSQCAQDGDRQAKAPSGPVSIFEHSV